LNLAKVTIVKISVKICRYKLCSGVATYAATPLHSLQRRIFTEILTIVTLARFKNELPDDGHRPKHVGAFKCEF